jgi:serine/threonine-protein kinase
VAICPTCNAQLPDNARFCPKDGTTVRPDSVLIDVSAVARAVTTAGRARRRPSRVSTATDKPEEDPLIGRTLDGRYRVIRRLGQGGVGAVYEAEHTGTKKIVAVKVLHAIYGSTEESRIRFEREARAASKLSHPTCVKVVDFGRVEKVDPPGGYLIGMTYLVMEFVKGTLLLDRLIDGGSGGPKIEPAEAIYYALDILAALKHAHGLGIVHRDLKPANVMLLDATGDDSTSAKVKLLDFGLAKDMSPTSDNQPLTQAGTVFGTPGYLSPEQASGRPIDERADLYSLGVVLFEMVTNRRLWERDDPLDAVHDHLNTRPDDPCTVNPTVSQPLAKAILKALAKKPAERFANAAEFAAALEACPELTGAKARLKLPKIRPLWAGAAAAVVAIAVAIGFGLSRGNHPKSEPAAQVAPSQALAATVGGIRPRAQHHLDLAAQYQRQLWCSDALLELERAMKEQPDLESPELERIANSCMGPKTRDKAMRFLEEHVRRVE